MKKILVPIDFSKVSHNAFTYAIALAEKWKSEIDLVYMYNGSFRPNDPVAVFNINKTRQQVLKERVEEFSKTSAENEDTIISVATNVKINCKAIFGFSTANSITKMSAEYDLIVMGTRGSHDIVNHLLGTVSSSVAQNALCPVLLVPPTASLTTLDKIVYASNWESSRINIIQDIGKWATDFQSSVDFVHVEESQEVLDIDTIAEKIYDALFDKKECPFSFNVINIKEEDPMKAILNYTEQEQADLLVLVNSKRGFIYNTLGMCMTKKLALKAQQAILIYHYDSAAFL